MEKKHQDLLKSVLEKRRNCIPLNNEEQKFADDTYGQLFEKKFGNRTFTVATGDEIRKATKNANAQPVEPIAEERSKFGTKDAKIENDDPSGTVKAVEEGDMVNVDEKDSPGEEVYTNASDITNADNDEDQRKPVFKFGDVVVKAIKGNLYAGVILKYYEQQDAVMVKWANGTFTNEYSSALKLAKDAFPKEDDIQKPEVEEETEPVAEEATETPKEEITKPVAEEAPVEEGTEVNADDEDASENEWQSKCVKAVGTNSDVEDAGSMCSFVRKSMKKSGENIIKMTVQEIRETGNNKLADSMEKSGKKELNFDSSEIEKGGPGSGRHDEGGPSRLRAGTHQGEQFTDIRKPKGTQFLSPEEMEAGKKTVIITAKPTIKE